MLSRHRSYALLTVLLAASTLGAAASLSAQEVVAPVLETAGGAPVASASSVSVAKGASTIPLGMRVASPFVQTVSTPFAVLAPVDVIAVQDRVRPGQNILLMTLGGAALVTGLIVGGDTGTIIATTGTVVALIGLYRYLN